MRFRSRPSLGSATRAGISSGQAPLAYLGEPVPHLAGREPSIWAPSGSPTDTMASMASSSVVGGVLEAFRVCSGERAPGSSGGVFRRRRVGVLRAGLVCLALGVGGCTSDPPPPAEVTPTTDVESVVSALELLETDPGKVAAEGVSQMVGDLSAALPPGSTIEADPATWAPDGTGSGGVITVQVSAEGGPAVDYLVVMVKEPSGWKVLATVPEGDGGTS